MNSGSPWQRLECQNSPMFWLISLLVLCTSSSLSRTRPPPHACPSLCWCTTWITLEKTKLETEHSPSVGLGERVRARKAGFPLRKCCSSPLSINTGKETQKKSPRLTISTVNTYCTALRSVPLGQRVHFIYVSEWIWDSGNSFTSSNSECSYSFFFTLKCFISTAVIKR